MPAKRQKSPRPKHAHEWYPISWNPRNKEPVLWACAAYWWCIETTGMEMKGRGKNRKAYPPENTVPIPTKGLWGATDKPPEVTT